jgi:hypothetical protein
MHGGSNVYGNEETIEHEELLASGWFFFSLFYNFQTFHSGKASVLCEGRCISQILQVTSTLRKGALLLTSFAKFGGW